MTRGRKPGTRVAMARLIGQVRAALPFAADPDRLCNGECRGCALKLLEYLDGELQTWEGRLAAGETPRLGDLHRLGRTARKVHDALERSGHLEQAE